MLNFKFQDPNLFREYTTYKYMYITLLCRKINFHIRTACFCYVFTWSYGVVSTSRNNQLRTNIQKNTCPGCAWSAYGGNQFPTLEEYFCYDTICFTHELRIYSWLEFLFGVRHTYNKLDYTSANTNNIQTRQRCIWYSNTFSTLCTYYTQRTDSSISPNMP